MTTDNLSQYLGALERLERYRSDSTIKSSDAETTELVFRTADDGSEEGPFIRKTIKRDRGIGSAYERIYAEQQKGRRFSHIPAILECCKSEADLIVIMEYVRGETLQDLIYRQDPSLELVAHIFPSVCDAVSELHSAFDPPLIHRDLKPSNIMIAKGHAYIIDFGIARTFNQAARSDTAQFGTRAYAPPEQFGYGQTTTRSDIYSLGMLLYFCLVERTPDASLAERGFVDPQIPKSLQTVLANACAFDPKYRYESAAQMKADLEAALFVLRLAHNTSVVPNNEEVAQTMQDEPPAPPVAPPPVAPPMANPLPHAAPTPAAAPSKPKRVHGRVYNWVVVILGALVVYGCVACIVDVRGAMAQYPRWASTLAYTALAFCAVSTTLVLLEKDRMKKRWPKLFEHFPQRRLRWIMGISYVIFFVTVVVLTAVGPHAS